MRFGICIDILKAPECKRLGFDYVEGKLNAIAQLSDEDFASALDVVKESRIKVEACSLLFPKTMKLLGPNAVGSAEFVSYLHKAFSRMQNLGASIAVFGSGKSRFVPAGVRWTDAFEQLVDITTQIGNVASKYGVTIVIEPLNRSETNLINYMVEGSLLAYQVGLSNVGLLSDLYHVAKENEDMARISLVSPLLHTHVALLDGRKYPVRKDPELVSFFSELKAVGYDGRMSIEGSSSDWIADSKVALKVLRELDGNCDYVSGGLNG